MKTRRHLLALFLAALLLWPSLALAQDAQSADGSGGTPTDQGQGDEELKNAAEGINVDLKVPLPFVPMNCRTPEGALAVCNLKDYIEGIYRLLIGVGALFAVVMIIIAGYQYLTSGGSADKTGAAKKRIWNASVGLILALLSYVILNAVSSRLVEMELPKIEPIKPVFDDANLACQNHAKVQGPLADIEADASAYKVPLEEARCGKKYVDSKSGTQCWGNKCPDPETACVKDECRDVLLHGNISWPGFGSNGYVDSIQVVPICNNMSASPLLTFLRSLNASLPYSGKVAYKSIAHQNSYFLEKQSFIDSLFVFTDQEIFDISRAEIGEELSNRCGAWGGVRGFVLLIEVNDDSSFFGPTFDDTFVLGRNCARPFYMADASGAKIYDAREIDWSGLPASQMFQAGDFVNGSAQCNIEIDRGVFPAR